MRGDATKTPPLTYLSKTPFSGFIEGFTKKEANPDEANPEEPAASLYIRNANAQLIAGQRR